MLLVGSLICAEIFLYEYSKVAYPSCFYTFSMENENSLMKCIRLECFRNRKKNAYIHLRQIKI